MTQLSKIEKAISVIDTAKKIYQGMTQGVNDLKDLEIRSQFIELKSALLDSQEAILNLKQEFEEKDNEIAELKSQLKTKGTLKYEAPFYWLIEGELRDGPYCQNCQDDQNKFIRLQMSSDKYWMCRTCNNGFDEEPNSLLSLLNT